MKPVKEILQRYKVGKGWVDPFAGLYSPAEITNDINPKMKAQYHLHAKEFLLLLNDQYEGALFDPPYSLRQVKECYDNIGIKLLSKEETNHFPRNIKNILAPKIKYSGYVISFGWSSEGFGMKYGFKIIEIMLLTHGGKHNDTIITIEQKVTNQMEIGDIC